MITDKDILRLDLITSQIKKLEAEAAEIKDRVRLEFISGKTVYKNPNNPETEFVLSVSKPTERMSIDLAKTVLTAKEYAQVVVFEPKLDKDLVNKFLSGELRSAICKQGAKTVSITLVDRD